MRYAPIIFNAAEYKKIYFISVFEGTLLIKTSYHVLLGKRLEIWRFNVQSLCFEGISSMWRDQSSVEVCSDGEFYKS
jgi:hypothetical protein